MNAQRRTSINKIISTLQDAVSELESIAAEEQDAFDNTPEGLQGSERGQKTEECAQALQSACDEIASQIGDLESAVAE